MKLRNIIIPVLVAAASLASTQTISEDAKANVLAAVGKHVKESAYVSGVDFTKWDSFAFKYDQDFHKATTHEGFAQAVNKALDEFGFSHIQMLTPRAAQTRTTGKSVGIGVLIQPVTNGIRIVKVLPGGPAQKAGLKIDDVIVKADGKPVTSPEEVRGPKDTKVVVTILRDGKETNYTITRGVFSLLVKDELKWIDDKTVMLTINSFATGYSQSAIDGLFDQASKAQRMIIDLRSNGGGSVMSLGHLAGKVFKREVTLGKFITRSHADEFKKKFPDKVADPIAVSKDFGWPVQSFARQNSKTFDGELVVLISPASASASEIFAAGIADNHRGKVVGTKSAGAVLASSFMRLPEGFSLQLPLMEYVTPAGRRLEGSGVAPDITLDPAKLSDDKAWLEAAKLAFQSLQKGGAPIGLNR
ncbi:MAG: S41 family peptidase [Fimbriimonadales bacterium]